MADIGVPLKWTIAVFFTATVLFAQDQSSKTQKSVRMFVSPDSHPQADDLKSASLTLKEDGIRRTILNVKAPNCNRSSDKLLKYKNIGTVVILLESSNSMDTDSSAKATSSRLLRQLSDPPSAAVYAIDGMAFQVMTDFQESAGRAQRILKSVDRPIESGSKVFEKTQRLNSYRQAIIPVEDLRIRSLSVIEAIAHHVSSLPGHKSLIWYCSETSIPKEAPPVSSRVRDSWFAALYALQAASMSVYPVECFSGIPDLSPRLRQRLPQYRNAIPEAPIGSQTRDPNGDKKMVATVAEATGGKYFLGFNLLEKAFQTAVQDNRCPYQVAWSQSSRDPETTSTFHKLEITDGRDRSLLRYPKVRIEISDSPESEKARISDIERCISTPLEETSLPIKAAIERPGAARDYFVMRCQITSPHGSPLDVLLTFLDGRGARMSQGIKTFVQAPLDTAVKNSGSFVTSLAFQPPNGAQRVRIAVRSMESHAVGTSTLMLK